MNLLSRACMGRWRLCSKRKADAVSNDDRHFTTVSRSVLLFAVIPSVRLKKDCPPS